MLEAEMDQQLGYEPYERTDNENSRNGTKPKKIRSTYGETQIDVPQDRESSFEPQIVKKHCNDRNTFTPQFINSFIRDVYEYYHSDAYKTANDVVVVID